MAFSKYGDKLVLGGPDYVCDEIKPGVYLMDTSDRLGIHLVDQSDFKIPTKIYGDEREIAQRYVNTFNSIDTNLGIFLSGSKGTGKTLLAKLTAKLSGLPVILVTAPFSGPKFENFLSNIKQEVVIIFDEFEKVYREQEDQEALLPVLDGVFDSKKMFILTSNERWINQFLLNRPGRLHYFRKYENLDSKVVKDVIKDKLINKKHKKDLVRVTQILSNINIDMLLHLIQEINMYDEEPSEAIKYLNIELEKDYYDLDIYKDGIKIGVSGLNNHPLAHSRFRVEFVNITKKVKTDKYGDERTESFMVNVKDSKVKTTNNSITIKYEDYSIIAKKSPQYSYVF